MHLLDDSVSVLKRPNAMVWPDGTPVPCLCNSKYLTQQSRAGTAVRVLPLPARIVAGTHRVLLLQERLCSPRSVFRGAHRPLFRV